MLTLRTSIFGLDSLTGHSSPPSLGCSFLKTIKLRKVKFYLRNIYTENYLQGRNFGQLAMATLALTLKQCQCEGRAEQRVGRRGPGPFFLYGIGEKSYKICIILEFSACLLSAHE
jgi:hypothetical protein